MTTKDTDVSEHCLINLIYKHLKENGQEKAANVLKKHAPQVEATSGKESLNDIFKRWVSNKRRRKSGRDILEAKASKPKVSRKAAHSITSNHNDKSQKKRRGKKDTSNLAEAPKDLDLSLRTGDDSDSDSSLDVEKWKRFALEQSDADIRKIDAFTKLSTQKRPPRKRNPAQTKKDSSPKMKAKKTKTAITPSKTKKNGTPLKTSIKKVTRKNTTPSRKLKDKGSSSEFMKVETPGTKFAKGLSEHTVSSKRVRTIGHLETDSIKTQIKKVKHKKAQSFLESSNVEIPTQAAECQKSDELVEPEKVKTPCKKAKSKKKNLETPSKMSDTKTPNSDKSIRNCDLLDATFDDIPSKKAKSKKPVKHVEPSNVETHSETVEHETAFVHTPSKKSKNKNLLDNPKTDETPSKQSKKKSLKCTTPVKEIETEMASRLLTPDHPKTPSKKAKAKKTKCVLEPDPVEIPRKKAKGKKTDTSSQLTGVETQKTEDHSADALSKATHYKSPSKKAKHHTGNSISETSPKKSKTKKGTNMDRVQSPSENTSVDLGTEESTSDKNNCNISDCGGKNKTTPVSHKSKSALKSALSSSKQSTELQDTYCPQTQIQNEKKTGEENIMAPELEEGPTEPKKRTKDKVKKKKETEGCVVEEVLPSSEEIMDNLASSANKKKTKKKKYSDEKTPVCVPAHEEETPNKKKKYLNGESSSKQSTELQDTYCPQTQIQNEKKTGEENIMASELEEGPTEPKKRKKDKVKKKKETEGCVVEEVLPSSEEIMDNLASSANKKKMKKKKYSDEKTPVCVPAHEEETPNKKKKSLNGERC
ncbi:uncharacterized protein LOC143514508 isoform X2 [Brachyhypopomus gauderio]|uniref:uncharacterized protein LOC143514508 isoform X2 n=1 Tax=Brachyhypopomus gauderio TaxID=698409 RepID=UPI00404382FF